MPTLGVIGSGNVGAAIARLAVDAGLDVLLSNSRSPNTLSGLAGRLGPRARATTAAEAAEAGDWTVVAIPYGNYSQLSRDSLTGRIVIDTNNYYAPRDGRIAVLDSRKVTDSELLGRHLSRSRVVKTFNTIYFQHLVNLARPTAAPDRTALPIAGDDESAKSSVAALLDRLGFDAVDLGSLAESWRVQAGSPAFVLPYQSNPALPWPLDPGAVANVAAIRAALAAARR